MKKQIYIQLLILIILSAPAFSQGKYQLKIRDSAVPVFAKQDLSLWGEISVGYSNDGVMGNLALSYRKRKSLLGIAYYKSHVCYEENNDHEYFTNINNSQHHKTVQSVALFSGFVFRGKWTPALSFGISWLQFSYVTTVPIDENVTFERIWQTIVGSDYKNEVLSAKTISDVGIPLRFSLHFGARHFAGIYASGYANLNTHHVLFSAAVGIDLGRVRSRRTA